MIHICNDLSYITYTPSSISAEAEKLIAVEVIPDAPPTKPIVGTEVVAEALPTKLKTDNLELPSQLIS